MESSEKILILDFGSQYTELIARKIREQDVFSEVVPFDYDLEKIKNDHIKGIVLSGGPNSIYAPEAPKCHKEIFELGIPVLGICYGMQLLSHELGGEVKKGKKHEYGHAEINITSNNSIFTGLSGKDLKVWMSHGDSVSALPKGFETIAKTSSTPFAAIANHDKKIYGVQFHPEVSHTENGSQIIKSFVRDICACKEKWNMHDFIEVESNEIKKIVGDKKVLLALSGGVDSSTLAFLLHQAIGDQLVCMYIDHGFMRMNETEELVKIFKDDFQMNIDCVDAKDRFWNALKGVSDPEQKRKIIGNEFIKTFEEEVLKLKKEHGDIEFLAQGTLYPDVIESAGVRIDPKTGKRIAHTIKTHHNVGGLPEKMNFKLIEPLNTLFKDEVRALARELKVPEEIVKRHPFPGPGLAIRVLGEMTKEKLEIAKKSDLIVREEVIKANYYDEIWQLLTAVLPVKSVGVMGDQRTYAHPVVIRAVTSTDAMTADWSRIPHELLAKISNRIVNEVPGANRVVYDITSKPPGTIEWE